MTRVRAPRWRSTLLYGVPPAAWFGHLLVSYVLVPPACETSTAFLHATTAAFVAMAAAGIVVGRREQPGGGGTGLVLGGYFVLVILLQGTANAMVDPCA